MKDETSDNLDDAAPEYDFSTDVRGKHAASYSQGVAITVRKADGSYEEHSINLPEGAVVLDPDIRPYFPDAATVNRALRGLIDLIPNRQVDEPATEAIR
jgi:hypothetical protein